MAERPFLLSQSGPIGRAGPCGGSAAFVCHFGFPTTDSGKPVCSSRSARWHPRSSAADRCPPSTGPAGAGGVWTGRKTPLARLSGVTRLNQRGGASEVGRGHRALARWCPPRPRPQWECRCARTPSGPGGSGARWGGRGACQGNRRHRSPSHRSSGRCSPLCLADSLTNVAAVGAPHPRDRRAPKATPASADW